MAKANKANATLLATPASPHAEILETMDSVCRAVRKSMTRGLPEDRRHFLEELVAVSRMAAIAGEYAPAFKGYELLGRALGHVTENEVHLHAHQHLTTSALSGMKDADLAGLLAEASSRAVGEPGADADPGLDALLA